MNRLIVLLLLIFPLFFSCNANIYHNGGSDSDFESSSEAGINSSESFDETLAPSNVSASTYAYPDKIVISWSPVKLASKYVIERKAASADESAWKAIAEVSAGTHTYSDVYSIESSDPLKQGIGYVYRIFAKSSNGTVGAYSEEASGALLYSPTNVTTTKGDPNVEGITVSWDYIEGISSYQIYMRTSSDVPFSTVATVKAVHSSEDCKYTYPITDSNNSSYSGMELQFAVVSVSPQSSSIKSSDYDDPNLGYSIGYSYVKGAPAAVTGLVAEKGVRALPSEGIKITWDDQGEDIDYIIYRTTPAGVESKIYKIYNSQTLDRSVSSKVSFVDTSTDALDTGVEYTYSVIATTVMDNGVTAKGEAAYTTGYLFSPPDNVQFEKLVNDENGYGFQFSFDAPLGLRTEDEREEKSSYSFRIYGWNKSSNSSISGDNYTNASSIAAREVLAGNIRNTALVETVSVSDIASDGLYHATVYFGDTKNDMFVVSLYDGAKESLFAKMPFEWEGATYKEATVSENKPTSSPANSNGVYPVTITVSFNDFGFNYIDKLEILSPEGEVIASYDDINSTDVSSVEALSATAVPGKKYSYIIRTTDIFGYTLETPSAEGYGALTFETYKDVFESVCLKPWEKTAYLDSRWASFWPTSKIGTFISKGNSSSITDQMGSLGSHTESDHYRGGTVRYNATMGGKGGLIDFEYKNFGESDYMYHTGNYNMNVSAGGSGDATSNTNGFDISGWYPGHISLEKISVSGKKFVGQYVITQYYGDSSSASKDVSV